MKLLATGLLLGGLLISCWAAAQTDAYGSVICLVGPAPELSSGGGTQGIVKAIQQRVAYPPQALRAGVEGRVVVRFAVAASGKVRQVTILKSLRPDCDAAVVRAVWQLPRFKSIRQEWMPDYFTVPVTFQIEPDRPIRHRAASRRNSTP